MKCCLIAVLLLAQVNYCLAAEFPTSARAEKVFKQVKPKLNKQLLEKGLTLGSAIFVRIFKQSAKLELWVENRNSKFSLFKRYDICTFSGSLGPKLRMGDWQSPEGFYFVNSQRLNPWSKFHLSFNLGYPNAYDRFHKRTGSALMVHGNCVSIGCYAMTDPFIDEIYTLAAAALKNGQPFFRVHVFPFELNEKKLAEHKDSKWYGFWKNLKQGYDLFEANKIPPNVEVTAGKYSFND